VAIGLTSEGTIDWAHWGLKQATDYNHKAKVTPLISLATTNGKAQSPYTGDPSTFAWSDGTPTPVAMTNTGTQISSATAGDGFIVTAGASADSRKLRLYVGIFAATAAIEIKLSSTKGVDAMEADQLTSTNETWVVQVITVDYQDPNPQSTLSVRWAVQSTVSNKAAIHIKAATLQ
jgi:hypothetical protein